MHCIMQSVDSCQNTVLIDSSLDNVSKKRHVKILVIKTFPLWHTGHVALVV
jgi:hypothetical protein